MALPDWAKSAFSAMAGRALQALGFLFYLVGVGGVIVILGAGHKVIRHLSCGETVLAIGGLLLGLGLAVLLVKGGHRLLLLGKRLVAKQQENVSRRLVMDPDQPIVLYLRSFRDDDATAATPIAYVYRGVSFPRLSTEEEHLARAVRGLGQLLAIAEPDTLPHAGAIRLPAGPSQWQETVRELMQRARLVLIRVGGGAWLWWETEQALALVPRARLVFLVRFPPRDGEFMIGLGESDSGSNRPWFLLTNQRLLARDGRKKELKAIELAEVDTFTMNGRWTVTLAFQMRSGERLEFRKMGMAPREEFLAEAIGRCRSVMPEGQQMNP